MRYDSIFPSIPLLWLPMPSPCYCYSSTCAWAWAIHHSMGSHRCPHPPKRMIVSLPERDCQQRLSKGWAWGSCTPSVLGFSGFHLCCEFICVVSLSCPQAVFHSTSSSPLFTLFSAMFSEPQWGKEWCAYTREPLCC